MFGGKDGGEDRGEGWREGWLALPHGLMVQLTPVSLGVCLRFPRTGVARSAICPSASPATLGSWVPCCPWWGRLSSVAPLASHPAGGAGEGVLRGKGRQAGLV